jgi:hypothetical protein
MSQLKVVWRNSRTAEREKRWHELGCDVGRKLYVVEELVPLGDQKRWAQAVALEIVPGGPATAPRSGSAHSRRNQPAGACDIWHSCSHRTIWVQDCAHFTSRLYFLSTSRN